MTIRELTISARSKSCLMSAGYKEVEDLRNVSDETLLAIKNLNQACVTEIRDALNEIFNIQSSEENEDSGDILGRNSDTIDTAETEAKDMSIDELEFSIRTYNCLKRAGINTVGDICNKTIEDMMKVRNLGRRSLEEILVKLKELGLALKDDEADGEVINTTSVSTVDENTDIDELGLSIRSYNCLKRAGINTVGDLCNRTVDDVRWVRNLGRKSFEEILGKMNEQGLQFMETPKVDLPESVDESIDLSMLIANLELSPRAKSWLHRRKIVTVRDLCSITEEKFDEDRFLVRSKSEIQMMMSQMGICFRPADENSCLYLYPDSVKKIASEKEEAWEHRLFIEAAIVNYGWLSQYRKQVPVLWEYEDEDDRIDSRSKLSDLLQKKIEEIQDYVEKISDCMKSDIVESFGPPGEPGDVQEIIEATEKLMGIYKSIIRSRLSFRLIDASAEYRTLIASMCDVYESLCKNVDTLYQKLLVAKKQLEDLVAGRITDEGLSIDLNITLELEMDEVTNALKELNGEENCENEFEDTEIYVDEDSNLSVEFCGFEIDDSDNTVQFKIWVSNQTDEERHFWLKEVILEGKSIESIDSMGSVDANDSDFLTKWLTIEEFSGNKSISFCIEIDDEDDNELDNSQVVNCIIDFDSGKFDFIGLEEYDSEDDSTGDNLDDDFEEDEWNFSDEGNDVEKSELERIPGYPKKVEIVNKTLEITRRNDIKVEIAGVLWDKNGSLFTPSLKLRIKNLSTRSISSVRAKVVFYNMSVKEFWDEASDRSQSLQPQYSDLLFLNANVGYTNRISEESLPNITAQVFIDDRYYGSVDIPKSYTTNVLASFGEGGQLSSYSFEQLDDRNYGLIVTQSRWKHDDSLYVPYLKIDVLNQTMDSRSNIDLKVVFYDLENKNVWSEASSTVIGSGDYLLPGFKKTAFMSGSQGYSNQISENSLPKLSAEVFINGQCYGQVAVERTYSITEKKIHIRKSSSSDDDKFERKTDKDFYPIVTTSCWSKSLNLFVPYLKIDVTNQNNAPVSDIKLKVIFTNKEKKEIWSEVSDVLIGSSNTPLKGGYKKTSFIKASKGYTGQISENSLPQITAEVYINGDYYGEIEIERTYQSPKICKELSKRLRKRTLL